MTDLESMAREAGLVAYTADGAVCSASEALARFAALVRADERDRCLYWCSLADHEGYATHHIREGTPRSAA